MSGTKKKTPSRRPPASKKSPSRPPSARASSKPSPAAEPSSSTAPEAETTAAGSVPPAAPLSGEEPEAQAAETDRAETEVDIPVVNDVAPMGEDLPPETQASPSSGSRTTLVNDDAKGVPDVIVVEQVASAPELQPATSARPREPAPVPRPAPSTRSLDAAQRLTPIPAGVDPPEPDTEAHAVATQIRELEERLDRMIDEAARSQAPSPVERASSRPPPSVRNLTEAVDGTVFDTARELLSTDYYLRKWGRLGMRNRSEEVDDFGFDPVYEQKVLPFFNFLYERYFRVETSGIENVPMEGRCLLVANHSGTIPYDGVMLRTAVKRAHPARRDVRWLAEDFIFHFPFLGSFSNRIGAVRACQENAERLLKKESLVAVFPEGVKGIGKLFKERYRLQRFGRGGFIKLCLRTGTPIVPVAVIGAEEASPMLARIEYLSKAVGLPYIPVTPTFPLLGPLGLAPAPTKWRIAFGEPIHFDNYGPSDAEDEILVGRLGERVRTTIQAMIDRGLGERRSVFFG